MRTFPTKRSGKLVVVFIATLFLFSGVFLIKPRYAGAAFRFVAWADTKSDRSVLQKLSPEVKNKNPKFTIFPGDLCDSWGTSCIQTWVDAFNGGNNNGLINISFPTRGNHDSGASQSSWSSFFNQSTTASRVGATNYSELTKDMTFSFDVENSRIIGIDVLGSVGSMSSASIAWLDQRLTDAENRGLSHAFLFWHGPIYPMDGHCCSVAGSSLVNVLNKHPIVSATFHGHEHIVTYAHINSSKVPGITHEFEQVISGDAGAGPSSVQSSRADYYINFSGSNVGGYVTVDVNGPSFTLNYYKGGTSTSQKTLTFAKGNVTPPPTTPTPRPSVTTGTCGKPADANCDGKIDGFDYVTWWQNFNTSKMGPQWGDFNSSGFVDGFDYVIWWQNFGK